MTRRAYAKMNLALAVGRPVAAGKPKAGFHPICSWFALISMWDDVRVEATGPACAGNVASSGVPSGRAALTIEWADDSHPPAAAVVSPIDWPAEKDLCVRAHAALEQTTGLFLPARIHVRKRIPIGGGLGGGSSDAAATLLALVELFNLRLTRDELRAVGASLGSDVVFFLAAREKRGAGGAIVTGFGECVEAVAHVAGRVVLVVPPFGCATPAVYRAFDAGFAAGGREARERGAERESARRGDDGRPARAFDSARVREIVKEAVGGERGGGRIDSSALFNDLAGPAMRVEPRLGELAAALRTAAGTPVHVSGSGSTLFLICGSGDKPGRSADDLISACERAGSEFGAKVVAVDLV